MVRERAHLLAEDGVAREAGLVLPHVRERRAPVDVSDGVEPAALDAHGAKRVVDGDDAARLEPDGLEADVGGVRPTPDADEQLVRGQLAAVLERQRDDTVRPGRRGGACLEEDGDALGLEGGEHLLAGERLLAADESRPALDERHRASEAGERLCELDAHGATAEDEQAVGNTRRLGRLAVRPGQDVWRARRSAGGSGTVPVATTTARAASRRVVLPVGA